MRTLYKKMGLSEQKGLALKAVLVITAVFLFVPDIAAASIHENIPGVGTATSIIDALVNISFNIVSLAIALPMIIIYIFSLVAALAAYIATFLVHGLASSLLTVPVMPSDVAVVGAGWEFVRNFVYLFFIVILAFIGLATILRWQTYALKQNLPAFLAVALLINFSAVFVGFVVDIANIITAFFLDRMGSWNFVTGGMLDLANLPGSYWDAMWDINRDEGMIPHILNLMGPIIQLAAATVYFIALALTMIAIFILFMVRIAMLWTITILSPFAFAAYVLPATRQYATKWFTQLVQWAFIGIPMLFFLALSSHVLVMTDPSSDSPDASIGSSMTQMEVEEGFDPRVGDSCEDSDTLSCSLGEIAADTAQMFAETFMGPSVAVILLMIGFTISISMGPSATETVSNFLIDKSRSAGVGAAKWAGEKARRSVAKNKGVQRIASRMEQYQGKSGLGNKVVGGTVRSIGRMGGSTMRESLERDTKEAQKKASEMSLERMSSNLKGSGQEHEEIGMFNEAIENNKLDKLKKEHGNPAALNTKIAKLYNEAKARGTDKKFTDNVEGALPHIALSEEAMAATWKSKRVDALMEQNKDKNRGDRVSRKKAVEMANNEYTQEHGQKEREKIIKSKDPNEAALLSDSFFQAINDEQDPNRRTAKMAMKAMQKNWGKSHMAKIIENDKDGERADAFTSSILESANLGPVDGPSAPDQTPLVDGDDSAVQRMMSTQGISEEDARKKVTAIKWLADPNRGNNKGLADYIRNNPGNFAF